MQLAATPDYQSLYEQSQLRIITLEQQLQQLQKMIFGSRQERFVPAFASEPQLTFDIQVEPVAAVSLVNAQKISYTRHTTKEETSPIQHPGRMKLPESLRREEITIEPEADVTGCKKIGEEITEVLEYAPGELYVKQYKRPKYALPDHGVLLSGSFLPVH